MPDVTVLVPVFNSPDLVRGCIESVLRWTDPGSAKILMANDGSDEATTAELRRLAGVNDHVELIENPRNLGYVRTCLRALDRVEGEFLVVLNSDTAVAPRWLDKLIACMRSDDLIALASPILSSGWLLFIEVVPGLSHIEMNEMIESIAEPVYPDVPVADGACLMARVSILEEIGFFDPVFDHGYGEETDLAMRAAYQGYRVVCADDTYVYHRGGGSFSTERRERLTRRSREIVSARWGSGYWAARKAFEQDNPITGLEAEVNRRAADGWAADRGSPQ